MQPVLKCRVGDLAVIVDAYNKCNLGKIVQVVEPYDESKVDHQLRSSGYDWIVECPSPLVWEQDGTQKRFRRKRGPVPDFALQPIRGQRSSDENSAKKVNGKVATKVAGKETENTASLLNE